MVCAHHHIFYIFVGRRSFQIGRGRSILSNRVFDRSSDLGSRGCKLMGAYMGSAVSIHPQPQRRGKNAEAEETRPCSYDNAQDGKGC
jgi:hypothetical protein